MNAKIEFIKEPGYIKASIKGEWIISNVYTFIDEIKIASTNYNCLLILIDMYGVLKPESEMTRFYSGVYMSKVLGAPLKIAIYASKEITNNFGETVALNRGVLTKVFHYEKDALEWLMEN